MRLLMGVAIAMIATGALAQTTSTNCTRIGSQLFCNSYSPTPAASPLPTITPFNLGNALEQAERIRQMRLQNEAMQRQAQQDDQAQRSAPPLQIAPSPSPDDAPRQPFSEWASEHLALKGWTPFTTEGDRYTFYEKAPSEGDHPRLWSRMEYDSGVHPYASQSMLIEFDCAREKALIVQGSIYPRNNLIGDEIPDPNAGKWFYPPPNSIGRQYMGLACKAS